MKMAIQSNRRMTVLFTDDPDPNFDLIEMTIKDLRKIGGKYDIQMNDKDGSVKCYTEVGMGILEGLAASSRGSGRRLKFYVYATDLEGNR